MIDRRTFVTACAALPFAAPALSATRWPNGFVSLTYDDGLDSQLDVAVPQLQDAGFKGTFFLTWDNIKERANEWAAVARRGHELANHSVTHPCDLQHQDPFSFDKREIDPLQRWLGSVEGARAPRDYAYPCDVTDLGPGTANQQARRYAEVLRKAGIARSRTSEGPPNSFFWAKHAPYRLQALALAYDTRGLSDVQNYLQFAIKRRRWAILVIHEIGDGKRSDGVIHPDEHAALLRMIARMKIPCGTMDAASSVST